MCHHICPIGNATGQERSTPRARALGLSLVNREAMDISEVMDNVYECATCGACVHECVTGWDPVMFAKEARLQAALEDKLPSYINTLVDNCLDFGNAYGKNTVCESLSKMIKAHSEKKDSLFFLGADARYMVCAQAVSAVKVLEGAGVNFTLLENEPASGSQLEFLIGKADETAVQMTACAKILNEYKTVVVYDPEDSKTIKQLYKEYGIEVKAAVITYTAYLASLLKENKLKANSSDREVVFQDPYQLARDLEETEEAREVISAFAKLSEMHLNRKETIFAGNVLMAQYMPDVIRNVAKRRIFNAKSIGAKAIVTASVSEYAALSGVEQNEIEIISLDDLILGK